MWYFQRSRKLFNLSFILGCSVDAVRLRGTQFSIHLPDEAGCHLSKPGSSQHDGGSG